MRQTLRQIVAVLALIGMSMSIAPTTFAASYSDASAANKLAATGIIQDHSAKIADYRLGDNVLRQEAVGIAGRVSGVIPNSPVSAYDCQDMFSDVSEGWVCRAAELAAAARIINANNTTFRPLDKVTRYEAVVMALKSSCLNPIDADGTTHIQQTANRAVEAGLISNAASFNANAVATRGEVFRYAAYAMDYAENNSDEMDDSLPTCAERMNGEEGGNDILCVLDPSFCATEENNTTTSGTSTSGSVSVSLSSGQPTGLIVAGQATADLAKFTFSGNGTVNSVVLQRSGISDQNTLSNVYLYDGNVRLTDGYSFNSNGTITINNLGLAVNGSKTLSVRADVASAAPSGQTVVVSLTGYTVAGSSAASVNLTGNTLTTGSGSTLATVTFNAVNSTSAATVNAGISSYVFWSQTVQVNTRTVHLKAANFRMVGSAPADALSNIRLFVDGIDTGKTATINMTNGSNYASFDLGSSPLSLTTGSHTVEVRANVEKGSNRTIQMSIQQASDLMILDPQVGVNIAIGTSGSGVIPSAAGTITISTGSVTVELDSAFNAMTNVTGGGSNTVIAKYKLHAYGEDIKIQTLVVDPSFPTAPTLATGSCTNATDCTLDDVTLYYNGSQVGTQQDWTGLAATDLTYTLGSQVIVPAGTDAILEVRANVRSSGGVNYTAGAVRANLNVGSSNAQGQSSLNTLNTPARTSNTLTIQTGNLSVSKNSAYANTSANPNTSEVKIGSFVLQNQSTSEGVRVTNLAVALTLGGGTSLTNFSSLKTSETTGSGANPIQPQATNAFSVDFTLAPGATKTIDVFATSSSDAGGTVTIIPTLTVTSIGATSNVSATSSAIVGQTITFNNATITTPTTATNFIANASTNAQFIAAGTTGTGLVDGSKSVFKLVASGGVATVSEMKFVVTGTDTVSSIRVGNSSAPVVSGVAYLTGLSLVVPDGGSGLSIDVYPTYSKVGTNGLASSTTSVVALNYLKYTSGGTTSTICTAALGTCTAVIAVGGVVSNTMTLVASKPTITVAKPVGVVAAVGNIEAIDVTVTADAKGDITLNSLPITVGLGGGSTTVNALLNTIVVTKADNSPVTVTNSAFVGGTAGGASTITFTGGYLIPAGTSQTFRIFVPVTAVTAGVSGSTSVSTSLATGSGFSWTDTAGAGSAVTGTTNIFGYPNTFTSTINN